MFDSGCFHELEDSEMFDTALDPERYGENPKLEIGLSSARSSRELRR